MPCVCKLSRLHQTIQYQDCPLNTNKFVLNAHYHFFPLLLIAIFLILRIVRNCLRPLVLIGPLHLLVTVNASVPVHLLLLFNECLDNSMFTVYDTAAQSFSRNEYLKKNLCPNPNIS